MTSSQQQWIEKIEALVSKANDPATTEAEREAYMDKVYFLMAKFSIQESMLRTVEVGPPAVARCTIKVTNPHYAAKRELLLGAVDLFGCRSIRKADKQTQVIYGFEHDNTQIVLLYASLGVQMLTALSQAKKPSYVHGRTFNNSFTIGFATSVRDRIRLMVDAAKQNVKDEGGTGMELVLLDKKKRLEAAVNEEFPMVTFTNGPSVRDASSYAAGRAAGQRADLGQSRIHNASGGARAIGGR